MKTVKKGMVLAVMALCAGLAFAKKEKIKAGSAENPFAGTKWYLNSECYSFSDDTVSITVQGEKTYTVKKNGDGYKAEISFGSDSFHTFSIESEDAQTATVIMIMGDSKSPSYTAKRG